MAGKKAPARAVARWRAEDARAALEAWQQSGDSGAAFARRIGVSEQRLFWWRKRLGGANEGGGGSGRVFVPVVVAQRSPDPVVVPVAVALGGNARLEVHEVSAESAAWVAMVIRAVAGERM